MKIENYYYPDIILSNVLESNNALVEKMGDMTASKEEVGKILGYSSYSGGAFISKLSALKNIGLLEGDDKIRVTQLGKELKYALTEDDRTIALANAYSRISLYKLLFNFLKGSTDDKERFFLALKNITNAPSEVIQKKGEDCQKLYNEIAAYLKRAEDIKFSQKFSGNKAQIENERAQFIPDTHQKKIDDAGTSPRVSVKQEGSISPPEGKIMTKNLWLIIKDILTGDLSGIKDDEEFNSKINNLKQACEAEKLNNTAFRLDLILEVLKDLKGITGSVDDRTTKKYLDKLQDALEIDLGVK